MPYVKPEHRPEFDPLIEQLASAVRDNPGELQPGFLNYIMTRLLVLTLPTRRYWALSAWHGIPQDVADEWYRRVMTPYEWQQQGANGDVYSEVSQ